MILFSLLSGEVSVETYCSKMKGFAFHYNLMFCQFMPKINCVSAGNKVDILIFNCIFS